MVGSTSRATQRATVDLPEPDSPTMPSVSPRRTVSDTSLTALTIRAFGWNSERLPKVLNSFSVCSTTGPLTGARFGGVMLGTAASSILV